MQRNECTEWWVVVLTTTKRGIEEYDVRVKEDTGTPANWIHPNVVKSCGLSSFEEACAPPRLFKDMSGKIFKCERCVRVTWCGKKRNSYEEVFLVSSEKAPIDMVLGSEFVDKHGRAKDNCADRPKAEDARMFVAKALTEEQERQMQANEIEHQKQSAEVIRRSQNQAGGSKRKGSASKRKCSSSRKGKDGEQR
ncbi:hypothetical protein F5Y16DRAFT_112541 [Xylariaceae sp. FL0255]|nr:hypothetical protein F5Y16DRAFT_112541 [Xylariaceae sp. FL0255]